MPRNTLMKSSWREKISILRPSTHDVTAADQITVNGEWSMISVSLYKLVPSWVRIRIQDLKFCSSDHQDHPQRVFWASEMGSSHFITKHIHLLFFFGRSALNRQTVVLTRGHLISKPHHGQLSANYVSRQHRIDLEISLSDPILPSPQNLDPNSFSLTVTCFWSLLTCLSAIWKTIRQESSGPQLGSRACFALRPVSDPENVWVHHQIRTSIDGMTADLFFMRVWIPVRSVWWSKLIRTYLNSTLLFWSEIQPVILHLGRSPRTCCSAHLLALGTPIVRYVCFG